MTSERKTAEPVDDSPTLPYRKRQPRDVGENLVGPATRNVELRLLRRLTHVVAMAFSPPGESSAEANC
jgi:hypothetical protein